LLEDIWTQPPKQTTRFLIRNTAMLKAVIFWLSRTRVTSTVALRIVSPGLALSGRKLARIEKPEIRIIGDTAHTRLLSVL